MATFIMKDTEIYLKDLNLSGKTNQVTLGLEVEMQDETVFGLGTRKNKPGLRTAALEVNTFYDNAAADPDLEEFGGPSQEGQLLAVIPQGSTEGNIAYFGEFQIESYALDGAVGDLLAVRLSANARYKPTQGKVFMPHVQDTGSDVSSKIQLGAITATKQLVAQVHLTQFDGTSLDIAVQSDADASAGGETTRVSMTQLTAVGSERKVYTTAQTDTYWRLSWTFVGTSFTAVVLLGIENQP